MANFDESKHPRDDDGKFTDGNGSRWTTSKRDYSNVQGGEAQRVFDEAKQLGVDTKGIDNLDVIKAKVEEKKRLQSDSESGKISLSKQEWAQYYKILGDEQHGDFVYHTQDGGRAVRLENKLLFDNGSFSTPKVNKMLKFDNNDLLNDAIEVLKGERYIL